MDISLLTAGTNATAKRVLAWQPRVSAMFQPCSWGSILTPRMGRWTTQQDSFLVAVHRCHEPMILNQGCQRRQAMLYEVRRKPEKCAAQPAISEPGNSHWCILDSADIIISFCKDRIYCHVGRGILTNIDQLIIWYVFCFVKSWLGFSGGLNLPEGTPARDK